MNCLRRKDNSMAAAAFPKAVAAFMMMYMTSILPLFLIVTA